MLKRGAGGTGDTEVMRRTADWHGRAEAAAWLEAMGLQAAPRWHVEVSVPAGDSTVFHLNVYAEEWGFALHHGDRSSWIRVTDIPFVHGRDQFGFITRVPPLRSIARFLAALELDHDIKWQWSDAAVLSNIAHANQVVSRWLTRGMVRGRRDSADLCGDEMHDGIRCTRERGHDGHHAFESDEGTLSWKGT